MTWDIHAKSQLGGKMSGACTLFFGKWGEGVAASCREAERASQPQALLPLQLPSVSKYCKKK